MFAHVIDVDRVAAIDFGTGDDPYKADWMDHTRPAGACARTSRALIRAPCAIGATGPIWHALARRAAGRTRLAPPDGDG
jgi:hypothetical protein